MVRRLPLRVSPSVTEAASAEREPAGGQGAMGRRGVVVELRRMGRVDAAEGKLAGTHADVERFRRTDRDGLAVDDDTRRTADVDHSHFAALQEEVHAESAADPFGQPNRAGERHDAADHDPVNLAVGHRHLARPEHLRDEELAAQALRVECSCLRAVDGLTRFHQTAPCVGSAAAAATRRRRGPA